MTTAPNPGTMADAHEPIDATVRLITPERIVFTYPLAGPCRRGLAYGIDLVCIAGLIALAIFLGMLLTWGGAAGAGLGMALTFGLLWGYGTACEGLCNGQTAGKWLVGVRVLTTQGVPISGSQAAIRNLVGTVDGPVPFLYVPGLVSMILTRRFQRLGDLAAGTMVVVEGIKNEATISRVADKVVADLLPFLPMRVSASPLQARALADYVKRRGRFGTDRREEIARHLAGPIRARHALPATATGDAVLCAFYHRLFLGD